MSAAARIAALKFRHPEWGPWLGVIASTLEHVHGTGWTVGVPRVPGQRTGSVPLMAGVAFRVDTAKVARLLAHVSASAAASGAANLASLRVVPDSTEFAMATFAAALNDDDETLVGLGQSVGTEPGAFRAVARLLPIPLLQALREHWAPELPRYWDAGYCPVCATWPAYAEMRGVERSRYLRCGACGSAWEASVLKCSGCGNTDHEELASLVVEDSRSPLTLDVCNRCRTYLKVTTTLQGSPPAEVLLDDLSTVALDLAAAGRGYARPRGRGCAVGVTLQPGDCRFAHPPGP